MSESYKDLRLGMMVTCVYAGKPCYKSNVILGRRANGSAIASLDELADGLDVKDLVDVAKSMCAEYMEFTAWHANMNVLYPSETMKRMLPGHCSRRDVIRDLINALKDTGIKLYLYVHPNDGHDFCKEDQDKVGWNEGPPYSRWNEFITAVFEELANRYKGEIAGYWVDGVGRPGGAMTQEDMVKLMEKFRRIDKNPEIIMNGDCGVGKWADYGSSESVRWPYAQGHKCRVTQTISLQYWADCGYAWFSPEMAFQYTVMQASVEGHIGGGVAWSAGPYPGGKWEPGVREFYSKLGSYIKPVLPTILGTKPSQSFTTPAGTYSLNDGDRWMLNVATQSKNGKETYVHVLRPPAVRTLNLPVPADGRKFSQAKLYATGKPVLFLQDNSGVHLTLSPSETWNMLDTVITLV
ncbi:MAG: alpha-L-fucosidase [Candidatus Omnitrophica bacterium]|nr:alpha-L-fucosidase [Candidatus Omnitrophota bacterium]